jgi:hypothetical protein
MGPTRPDASPAHRAHTRSHDDFQNKAGACQDAAQARAEARGAAVAGNAWSPNPRRLAAIPGSVRGSRGRPRGFRALAVVLLCVPGARRVGREWRVRGASERRGRSRNRYEIAPGFQNKGYATAAARSLLALAFSREEVSAVVAHTLAQENASNAVLKKIGMSLLAELPNPELGKVWKWGIRRTA